MDNWDTEAVFIDGKYIDEETWYDADGTRVHAAARTTTSAATTKFYGAALFRLRPQDFGDLHHVDGLSPAWPVSYDDFEPWYTKAEWLYQVHGTPRRGPHRRPWSKQYP